MSALAISTCNYIRILAEPYCEGGPIRQFLTRKCHFGDVPNGPATALGSPLVRVLRRGAPRRRAPPGSMRDSRHGRFTAHRRPSHRQPSACSGSIRDYSRGHPTNFLVFEPLHQRRPLFLWGAALPSVCHAHRGGHGSCLASGRAAPRLRCCVYRRVEAA